MTAMLADGLLNCMSVSSLTDTKQMIQTADSRHLRIVQRNLTIRTRKVWHFHEPPCGQSHVLNYLKNLSSESALLSELLQCIDQWDNNTLRLAKLWQDAIVCIKSLLHGSKNCKNKSVCKYSSPWWERPLLQKNSCITRALVYTHKSWLCDETNL